MERVTPYSTILKNDYHSYFLTQRYNLSNSERSVSHNREKTEYTWQKRNQEFEHTLTGHKAPTAPCCRVKDAKHSPGMRMGLSFAAGATNRKCLHVSIA